jgi:hypothetical protein
MAGSQAAFQNAIIWADRKYADFWINQSSASRLPASQHVFLKMAQAAVASADSATRTVALTEQGYTAVTSKEKRRQK